MKARTVVAALLLLSPLAQLALAANPVPAATHTAASNATDLALAGAGTTLAVALAAPVTTPSAGGGLPGGAPPVVAGDLSILDAEAGFAYYGSGNAATGPTGVTAPLGRTHVAVSRDGSTVASLGADRNPGAGGDQTKLYYQRVPPGTRWEPTTPATNLSIFVGSNATDILLSADGQRVVIALMDNDRYHIRGYSLSGGALGLKFSFDRTGAVHDLDGTSDLEHFLVAGTVVEAGETHGVLHHLTFSSGTSVETLYERSFNGSAIMSAAIAPDLRFFAGDGRGRVLYALRTPDLSALTLPGPAGNVTVHASADGKRLGAAVAGGGLAVLDVSGIPALRWNASLGEVKDFQLDATGSTLVAAINGTAPGAFAFGDNSSAPFWKVDGAITHVAINEAGTLAAYARGAVVASLKIPRAISFEYPNGLERGPVVTIKPLGTATIDLQVNNTGAAAETVVFDGPKGIDLTFSTATPSLTVAPGEAKKVSFTATAGKSFVGTHAFNVSARAITSGAVDNVSVTLQLATVTNVSLVEGTKEATVVPGQRFDLALGVINNGSRDAAVGIRATQSPSQGGAWNVTIDPSSFTLAPNTITTVRVTVIPPESAVNGTFNTVTFTLEGPEVADSSQVVFRINPTLSVEISANGRAKFVEPAKSAFYNVTVNNTGSLPRQFEAFFQATPTGGKNWAVDMDTAPFLLVPGGSKTIQVRVFAPVDATPSDRVSVLILARSIPELPNETVAQANLTLFANAVEPKPVTTTPSSVPVPALGPVAVVGALALLSLVLRPRRRNP